HGDIAERNAPWLVDSGDHSISDVSWIKCCILRIVGIAQFRCVVAFRQRRHDAAIARGVLTENANNGIRVDDASAKTRAGHTCWLDDGYFDLALRFDAK